jgi:spermidine/putrescine ABC transporter ATP-binding subunit
MSPVTDADRPSTAASADETPSIKTGKGVGRRLGRLRFTQRSQRQTEPDGYAVRLRDITKTYGSVIAVRGLDLDVHRGEFLSLLGPSGSGKTTTMRIIGGFVQPDAGRVEIDGRDVTAVEPFRRDVNTVFQSYALFPHMSVEANVAYGLKVKRVPRAERARRVGEALELVRLSHARRRSPHELSGGMQQRVALARALVNQPSVLLLDEPLGALDRKLREDMQLELRELQTAVGVTFVYITHDQEEALAMSDRLAVMRDGRIEQIGAPAVVYDEPANLWVARFVGASNCFAGVIVAVEDFVELDTDFGVIRGTQADPELRPGMRAVAVVRPENVELLEAASHNSFNCMHIWVREALNVGDQIKLFGATAGGLQVSACRQRTLVDTAAPAPGADVWIGWRPEAVRVFAEDDA